MTVYIPYGLICIVIAFVSFNAYKRAAKNKRYNRRIANKERLQNTLDILREAGKKNPKKDK